LKRLVPILLLSAYLISSTELYQLAKLPRLVEHFSLHKSRDNKLSVLEFLKLHYSKEEVWDADDTEDAKLPFKDHSYRANTISIALIEKTTASQLSTPLYSNIKSYPLYKEAFLTSFFISGVWQPPKNLLMPRDKF